ncbi:unnamed protein product [Candidula unifasciata]|uniref:RING-type E3 ubiquitin transferase n=1 Tax=Candidula unifasciata TaxID=100452 RepID=A0A8S3YVD7_9EUPU|nr:unnamed protein product [Candidula unifasciata]
MPVTRNQSSVAAKSSSEIPSTSGLKESSDGADKPTEAEASHRDSPENCSICLGPFINKSFTSSCAHSFCFVCLKQWSKVKAECPLCKQSFTGIFHNIRSNDSYDVYELPPVNPPTQIDYSYLYNYMGGHLATFAPTQHYFSLSQPSLDADLTLSNFSRFQFHHRRYNRYLNSDHSVHGEHQYSFPNSTFNPATHVSAASWPRGAEDFRLRVYRRHMGPPAVILGCENSNYRLTPAMVAASSHRLHRIMPWLTRELRVLLRSHQNVRQAIGIIQPLLTQVTIDSHYFSEKVSPIIGQKSRQFIQEFAAFANSALTLQAFDRKAMYRSRVARILYEDSSSSSSDDDVIEVTDASPDIRAHSSRNASTSLQGADRFSPTPGPSQEIFDSQDPPAQTEVDRVSVSSESDPVFRPGLDDSESENSEAGSDIVFVKYDKPWGKRSPIQLSSGSEGGDKSRKKKKMKSKKLKKRNLSEVKSLRKGKGQKSAKARGRDLLKGRAGSRSEWHYESESGAGPNIVCPLSSLVKQKKKKHKKSKEKNVDNLLCDKDREQPGRPADGIWHTENMDVGGGSGNINSLISDKRKDLHKKRGRSCDSDKGRRKRKKKKSLTKELAGSSPGLISYKKHHSGHKKSAGKGESSRRRHQHRHTSRIDHSSDSSSRTDSLDREMQAPRGQQVASSGVDHSGASTFQASYLARPDTVQHIPLNLWVSTWPSLPHTLPAASPSATFSSSLPHPLTSSSFPNQNLGNTSSEYTSQTISSDSESSNNSDSDTSADSSSPIPLRTRTKRWLDASYPELSLQPSSSSAIHTSSAPDLTQIWGIEHISSQSSDANVSARHSNNITDIVSVGSDDDDVVICSSTDESESDEVRVIEKSDVSIYSSSSSSSSFGSFATTAGVYRLAQTTYPSQSNIVSLMLGGRHSNNLIQSTSAPIVSFQTSRKSSSAEQSLDPVLSGLVTSTGSNVEAPTTSMQSDQPEIISSPIASSSMQDSQPGTSASELKSLTSSGNKETGIHHHNIFPPTLSGLLDTCYRTNTGLPPTSAAEKITAASMHADQSILTPTSLVMHADQSILTPTSSVMHADQSILTPTSSVSSSMFGVLPLQTSTSVTSMLSSNLNYLSYPPLTLSTNLPPLLPQTVPFMMPQPQTSSRLQLHYPFPPIQPLLTGPSSLFAPVYAGFSQVAQVASSSNTAVDTGRQSDTSVSDEMTMSTQGGNTDNITNPESNSANADKTTAFSEITELAPILSKTFHSGRHCEASSSSGTDDLSVTEATKINQSTSRGNNEHINSISICGDFETSIDIFESMSGLSPCAEAAVANGRVLFQQPSEGIPQCLNAETLHRDVEFDAFNIIDDVDCVAAEATNINNRSNHQTVTLEEGDYQEAGTLESTGSGTHQLFVTGADPDMSTVGTEVHADRLLQEAALETLDSRDISDEPLENVFVTYESSFVTGNMMCEASESVTSMDRQVEEINTAGIEDESVDVIDGSADMIDGSLESANRMGESLQVDIGSHSVDASALQPVDETQEELEAITNPLEADEASLTDIGDIFMSI